MERRGKEWQEGIADVVGDGDGGGSGGSSRDTVQTVLSKVAWELRLVITLLPPLDCNLSDGECPYPRPAPAPTGKVRNCPWIVLVSTTLRLLFHRVVR